MSATPRLNPPPYLQQDDKFVLQQRRVFTLKSSAIAVPPGLVLSDVEVLTETQFGAAAAAPTFTVAQDEAFRVVKGSWCSCFSVNAASVVTLRCQSLVLQLRGGNSQNITLRAWPGNYTGNVLGNVGQFLNVIDDELFIARDFLSQGTGPLQLVCVADIQNLDVVTRDVELDAVVMLEFYRLKTIAGMRGNA